jgi:DNA topoisomerase IB
MYVKHKNGYIHLKTGRSASANTREQIKSVYVPPGYSNVVYVLSKKLIATGVDSKGRTQYIYSNEHKQSRNKSRKHIFLQVSKVIGNV